jgi:hypothetical protein
MPYRSQQNGALWLGKIISLYVKFKALTLSATLLALLLPA